MYPLLATAVLVFVLAWWNPKFLQLPGASGPTGPVMPGMVSPWLLALSALILGAGSMYLSGKDLMEMKVWGPVLAGSVAIGALGWWGIPELMSKLPGGAPSDYGLTFLVVALLVKMLLGGRMIESYRW